MWPVIGVYICIVLSFFAGWICRVGFENANKQNKSIPKCGMCGRLGEFPGGGKENRCFVCR